MEACAACRATFVALDDLDPHSERALRLDEAEPGCRCQHLSVSEHSSGPVGPDEVLVRIVVAPQHVDKRKGTPKAAALTDAERGGLSMFREAQASNEEIRAVALGLVTRARTSQGDKAGVFGVLRIRCRTIRDCTAEGEDAPGYCVYDTADAKTPSHAEAFQRIAAADESLRDERRRTLFGLVKSEFVPVAEFRGGLLLDLAPKA